MGRLVVTSKGYAWFQKGHPWIFRSDLDRIDDAEPGGIVSLESPRGSFLAQGFYSDRSKIAFRLVSREKSPIDAQFWRRRIEMAHQYRQRVVERTNAYRLIYGESDGIPSLIVDRYGDHFVMQTLSQGAEKWLSTFGELLADLFRPASIILRNDLSVRDLEGLPQEKRVLFGTLPSPIKVFEGEVQYWVDPWRGQKTGAYLDQRENRQFASGLLQGKILDAFCYQGLFGLHAAQRGAAVLAIDASEEALAQAQKNFELNALETFELHKENVFDFLAREAEKGPRYDGIVLDPPAFAKRKENLWGASRGYRELNRRAIQLLHPGGVLVTCSCSYNLSEGRFLEVLKESGAEAQASMRLLAKRTQGLDHPILLSFPESYYLKCMILRKI